MGDFREGSGRSKADAESEQPVSFGAFRFALQTGELWRDGTQVKLTPRAATVLALLLERAQQLVTKQELFDRVWKRRAVGDEALTSCIQELRQALDDDAREPRYIETRYGRGYRLIVPVATAVPAALALPDKPSIAVMPFQSMSDDPEQEYFTDGVTEDIITELSRFHSLFVIARNSSFSYKGKSPNIQQVGKELGVRYVLEGSVRKASDRIRVTAQLIDTLTDAHLWAERYDRLLEDTFAVQTEVTQAIVASIAPQIEATERLKVALRRPDKFGAYEMALRASAHASEGQDKVDRELLEQSIAEAKEALAIDPNCVRALHALGYAHVITVFLLLTDDPAHALRQSMSAAARAIELDSADAFGYAQRAVAVFYGGQVDRFPEALADIRLAHEMNPNETRILRVLAALEAGMGEPERAIEHGHECLRLNPRDHRSYSTHVLLSFACFAAKRYVEGIGWSSRALNALPGSPSAHLNLAVCLVGAGDAERARGVFAAGQRLAPEFFKMRLEGKSTLYRQPDDRVRLQTFLRIAAGLEDRSAAAAFR